MIAHPELQPSGFSLHAPVEPEPRNVITANVADSASGFGSSSEHVSATAHATTGFTTDALENSANPASVVHHESYNEPAGTSQAAQQGSGWQWADRAQVRELLDIRALRVHSVLSYTLLTVRAYQRDGLHLLKLQDLVSDIVRSLIGR